MSWSFSKTPAVSIFSVTFLQSQIFAEQAKSGTVFLTHSSLNVVAVVGVRRPSISPLNPPIDPSTQTAPQSCELASVCFCVRPANETNRSDFPHLVTPPLGDVEAANPKALVLTVDDLRLSG